MDQELLKQHLIDLIASKVCKLYSKDICPSKWNVCCGECEFERHFQIRDIADVLIENGLGIVKKEQVYIESKNKNFNAGG
jgi:hypothetical protein